MSENLKRCPFCRGEARVKKIKLGKQRLFRVICPECLTATHLREEEKNAVAEWNTRPIEEELEKENKRLREALEHVVTTDTTVDKYGIWRIDGKTFQTWAADVLKGNKNV